MAPSAFKLPRIIALCAVLVFCLASIIGNNVVQAEGEAFTTAAPEKRNPEPVPEPKKKNTSTFDSTPMDAFNKREPEPAPEPAKMTTERFTNNKGQATTMIYPVDLPGLLPALSNKKRSPEPKPAQMTARAWTTEIVTESTGWVHTVGFDADDAGVPDGLIFPVIESMNKRAPEPVYSHPKPNDKVASNSIPNAKGSSNRPPPAVPSATNTMTSPEEVAPAKSPAPSSSALVSDDAASVTTAPAAANSVGAEQSTPVADSDTAVEREPAIEARALPNPGSHNDAGNQPPTNARTQPNANNEPPHKADEQKRDLEPGDKLGTIPHRVPVVPGMGKRNVAQSHGGSGGNKPPSDAGTPPAANAHASPPSPAMARSDDEGDDGYGAQAHKRDDAAGTDDGADGHGHIFGSVTPHYRAVREALGL